MQLPTIQGIIDRRILVNFRVDPDALSHVLPKPFRPQLVNGYGIAGICLIRLKAARPRFVPQFLGATSENAAHRIAVEWESGSQSEGSRQKRNGVYVPRRDTSSSLFAFAGGRLFPGVQHRAQFEVREDDEKFYVSMTSVDGATRVLVDGRLTDSLPEDSVFDSVEAVSEFFEGGSLGYSPARRTGEFDGIELQTKNWHVDPLAITRVESSFFEDTSIFPEGSTTIDNALLMRAIDHEWHGRETLCCDTAV